MNKLFLWRFLSLAVVALTLFSAERADSQILISRPIYGTVKLAADTVAVEGSPLVVRVLFTDTTAEIGGFNLLVEFDRNALVFDSASLGSLTKGQWNYFVSKASSAKSNDSSLSTIRLVAIASSSDPKDKAPSPRSLVGPGELAKLYFYVGEKRVMRGSYTQLNFTWIKCDDNSFSDKIGNMLFMSRNVFGSNGDQLSSPDDPHAGAKAKCFPVRRDRPNPAQRIFDFHDLKILIK